MPTLAMIEFPPSRSWDDLEELCWDLFRTEWNDPNAVRHGRQGQAQAGVDIYGRRNGRGPYIGVQCKAHGPRGTLTLPELRDEVRKAEMFEPPLAELVIATTAPRDAALQRAVRLLTQEREATGRFGVYVRFWEDLAARLALDRAMAKRHYPQLFAAEEPPCRPSARGGGAAGDAASALGPAHHQKLQVFVSSRMHAGLDAERLAVADALEGTGIARAWYWERDGHAAAGRYSDICLHHVLASDGLVLLLGGDLSPRVRKEYTAARRAGHPCYIFVKEGCQQDLQVSRFLERQRRSLSTRNFHNLSELRSHVVDALATEVARSWRERRMPARQPAAGPARVVRRRCTS